jgi:hypothetical protein
MTNHIRQALKKQLRDLGGDPDNLPTFEFPRRAVPSLELRRLMEKYPEVDKAIEMLACMIVVDEELSPELADQEPLFPLVGAILQRMRYRMTQ